MGVIKKLCLDPGHGGTDPGAVYDGCREKDIVLPFTLEVGDVLKRKGFEVCFTRVDDRFVPLANRVRISNEFGADRFLSIHCNADADFDMPGDKEADGIEVLHAGGRGRVVADRLGDVIQIWHQETRWRGVKHRPNVYVLKHTRAAAVLVELGFIDSTKDRARLLDPIQQASLAQTLAFGIVELL